MTSGWSLNKTQQKLHEITDKHSCGYRVMSFYHNTLKYLHGILAIFECV